MDWRRGTKLDEHFTMLTIHHTQFSSVYGSG